MSDHIGAQGQKTIDSLQVMINSSVDTTKVNGLNLMGTLMLQKDLPKANAYLRDALKLSRKISFTKGEAQSALLIGGFLNFTGKFDSALYYNKMAIDLFNSIKAFTKLSNAYIKRGHMLTRASKNQEALEAFNSGLTWARKQRDTLLMGNATSNCAHVYSSMGKMDDAIACHLQALKLYEAAGDSWGQVITLNNMAGVYRFQRQLKKSEQNYQRVLELSISMGRMDGIMSALDNLGANAMDGGDLDKGEKYLLMCIDSAKKYPKISAHPGTVILHLATLYHMKHDLKKAEKFYKEAQVLYEADSDIAGLSGLYTNLAVLYQENGHYKESVEMLLKNEKVILKLGAKPSLKELYTNLALSYSKMGDYRKAYEYSTICSTLKDTLYGAGNSERIAEMEAIYQNEKKQKELELSNSELAKKELELNKQQVEKLAFACGATAFLIFGIVLYRGNLKRRKANQLLQIQKTTIEIKNKDITDSIMYAKRLQSAVLPEPSTLSHYFSDSFILFMPRDIVSGDFYWFEQAGDKTIVAVGDCTGHGVPGAFMSILGHNLLNQIVMEYDITAPADILRMLDKQISGALNKKGSANEYNDGMDIAVCSIDKKAGKLFAAGANRPILIKRGGELIEVKPNKFPIGGIQDDTCKMFFPQEVNLEPGDVIYLFSDGFYDQFGGPGGKKLKYKNLLEQLKNENSASLTAHKDNLEQMFIAWKGNLEQLDDVCVVGIKI